MRSTNVAQIPIYMYVYIYVCVSTTLACEILYDGYPPTLPVRGNFSGERTLDDEDQHLSFRNLREEIERERERDFSSKRWIFLGRDTLSLVLSFSFFFS